MDAGLLKACPPLWSKWLEILLVLSPSLSAWEPPLDLFGLVKLETKSYWGSKCLASKVVYSTSCLWLGRLHHRLPLLFCSSIRTPQRCDSPGWHSSRWWCFWGSRQGPTLWHFRPNFDCCDCLPCPASPYLLSFR